ncbi:PilC/PilY family type IV pilus protein [Variovorax sp. J31P179]|uniref:pilus assembly protein n=1 Tax=Variovorax sp. J31P179 TaxID=3053508 RepID=UPI00257502D8|nr:PilC/PilY family type IV pilus protein [Variovorax sp. J31P179]MDM0080868.1 PilC/PilY family type IV pilus protein [Variovorax sp. J31P179]
MKKNLIKAICASVLLLLQMGPAQADDIDLFTGFNQSTTDIPNVLFVLDNTANWNQPFTAEMAALQTAFNSLPANKFRVGVMMFTETGKGDSNSDGAYLRAAIRTLDGTSQPKYSALIKSLDVTNDKSNGGKAGKTMVEVYRYLTGGAPYAGNNKAKTDFKTNTGVSTASDALYALAGNALGSKAGSPYLAPTSAGCAGTFIIYLSNGPVQDNTSDTKAATSELKAAGAGFTPKLPLTDWTTPIVLSPSGSQDNVADEWARFLFQSMGVKTFTLDVLPGTTGQGPGWSAMLQSMATVSQGTYFNLTNSATLEKDLTDAFGDIFSRIQSVNSAFASVSLPMSVNTQGTYLNQIFIGMFRPDAAAQPRWNGNIKQYKLGLDAGNNLILQDAADKNAVNSQTGFITPCARSFWTSSAADSYWAQTPSGDCLNAESSNSPDGNVVEKGAQGYLLRNMPVASRNLLTCSSSGCTALANFDDANTAITQTLLGVASTTARTNLINWARGLNNSTVTGDADKLLTNVAATAMRPSVHGDVVHSRPVALNYGTDASPQVVVFYGGNDGVLRAVNGNRTAAINGNAAGSELWSFMPPEFYGSLGRLYGNSPQISYPGLVTVASAPAPQPKAYGMDGPVAGYQSPGGNSIWVYAGMRRGGRSIYAFDASNMTKPTLKWRLGCPNASDDTGCSTGASGIGQTWSVPKVLTAPNYGGGTSPLLLVGGGYDKCEDADPSSCTGTSKGNQIYVVDADTGSILKTFSTSRGVTGEITVLNDSTGKAKIAYAADLGGNVYRIDGMATSAPGAWTLTRVASLGCDTVTTCSPSRKFMFSPDVVEDSSGANVLLIGSGDREKPLRSYTGALSVVNHFYMLVDKPSDSTWLSNESANCGVGNGFMCQASLLAINGTTNPDPAALASKKGWYLALAAGEQVVTSSVTAYGTTTFSTHIPSDPNHIQSCKADLGTANVYNLAYANAEGTGTGRFQNVVGGGLSPSPVVHRVLLDDGSQRDVVVGGSPVSPLAPTGAVPQAGFKQPKGRVYWFIQR